MKLSYTTKDGRFTAEFEGTQQEIFEEVSSFDEVFGENVFVDEQGNVHDDIRYLVRTDGEDNKYYEKVVMSGKHKYRKLAYGCNKKGGGLFPKRRDKDGKVVGHNGWGKYNKETGEVE